MLNFRSAYQTLSVLCFLSFSLSARAAVIYIDVNNNIEERGAYTSELAKAGNHEAFVAIPQIETSSAKLLTELGRLRDSMWDDYVAAGCVQDFAWHPVMGSQCNEKQKTLWATETRIAQIPKTNLTSEALRAALQNIQKSGQIAPGETITLVISGHFGGGVFTGNLGSMSVEEMGRIFAEFPAIQKQIVRLHLLGCYTNVFSQVTSLWRTSFPNARVLAGFYERSPSGGDSRNLKFIHFLVHNTAALDSIRTEKQFQTAMRAFRPYSPIHAALSVDNMYRETGDELMFVDETFIPLDRCRSRLTTADQSYFTKVFFGELPLPTDTDGSRLRHYYSALRDNALCLNEPAFTEVQPELPTPDLAMRLLFFKNVIINFRNLYRGKVALFDESLKGLGIEPSLYLENVDLSRRSSIVAWSSALTSKIKTMPEQGATDDVRTMLTGFKKILVDLEPACVPVNWVEPSAFMESACLAK